MSSAEHQGGPVWAIVVAGGSGQRFGGPKQWQEIGGRTLAELSVERCRTACDGVVLVVPSGTSPDLGSRTAADTVVVGGPTRADSVRRGLDAVPAPAEIIVVQDAVRPAASSALFQAVVAAVRAGADGAVPGIAVVDTLKAVRNDGSVERTVDRESLVAVQTPQAFKASALRRAHESQGEATDDAGLVEAGGGRVVVVPGETENVKVTTPSDLERVRNRAPGGAPALRIGHGFDIHRWSDAPRALVLGGVTLDRVRGLEGHSDADVVCHAAGDAILGAAALGDLGRHFPDDDPRWAGARSTDLLEQVVSLAKESGWTPASLDVTVVAEAPHLAPHIAEMRDNLERAVGVAVSIKATRAEGLGSLGRGEGIAAWAVALLSGG